MSCDQALDKLSEKLNSRMLVQEEHGFQKGGTICPPPLAAGAQKKPSLDRVNGNEVNNVSSCQTVGFRDRTRTAPGEKDHRCAFVIMQQQVSEQGSAPMGIQIHCWKTR